MCDAVGYKRLDSELIDAPDMQGVREKANQILALIKAIGKQYPFVAEL